MIKIKNYTDKEIQYIRNNFNNMTTKDISNVLNKKESSVYNAARKLGLKKQIHSQWTNFEIDFLKSNYINMTSEEISKYVNHSVNAINTMRDNLHLIRNQSWSDDEIEVLKNNFDSMLFADLSKILGRTEAALRAKCFELNLFKKNPWSNEEVEFVKKNYIEMKNSEISQILNRTMDAIELKASKLGLKKSPYICDYHYFDSIDTEEKAYWLGFLTADGWINKSKKTNSGVTGIELQYADINHLKKFNKSLSGNYKIADRWRPCGISTKDKNKLHHSCVIRIFSLTMYEALKKRGFSNEKSYDCDVPELRQDLLRHYIRGYFDGDGCFSLTNKSFHVNFVTASEKLNDGIMKILETEDLYIVKSNYINEFGTMFFRQEISRNSDKIKFLNWIYKDCNVYLDRKYNKFLKVLEHYNEISLAV